MWKIQILDAFNLSSGTGNDQDNGTIAFGKFVLGDWPDIAKRVKDGAFSCSLVSGDVHQGIVEVDFDVLYENIKGNPLRSNQCFLITNGLLEHQMKLINSGLFLQADRPEI